MTSTDLPPPRTGATPQAPPGPSATAVPGTATQEQLDMTRAEAGVDLAEAEDTTIELPEQGSSARAFFDWMIVIAVALLVALLVRGFVLAHFVVEGSSMYPTLESGDRVFVNKMSYRLHDPRRGDVVVLHQISGASERDLIKRVIGLPGERIEMRDCVVYIDGRVLVEPYLDPTVVTPTDCGSNFDQVLVPIGEVFVMGDNRGGSQDSRDIGTVSHDDLVGRAFVVFWPRDNWTWL